MIATERKKERAELAQTSQSTNATARFASVEASEAERPSQWDVSLELLQIPQKF